MATDKCIMLFLVLIVCGVIAIIIVKVISPTYPFVVMNLLSLSSLIEGMGFSI